MVTFTELMNARMAIVNNPMVLLLLNKDVEIELIYELSLSLSVKSVSLKTPLDRGRGHRKQYGGKQGDRFNRWVEEGFEALSLQEQEYLRCGPDQHHDNFGVVDHMWETFCGEALEEEARIGTNDWHWKDSEDVGNEEWEQFFYPETPEENYCWSDEEMDDEDLEEYDREEEGRILNAMMQERKAEDVGTFLEEGSSLIADIAEKAGYEPERMFLDLFFFADELREDLREYIFLKNHFRKGYAGVLSALCDRDNLVFEDNKMEEMRSIPRWMYDPYDLRVMFAKYRIGFLKRRERNKILRAINLIETHGWHFSKWYIGDYLKKRNQWRQRITTKAAA